MATIYGLQTMTKENPLRQNSSLRAEMGGNKHSGLPLHRNAITNSAENKKNDDTKRKGINENVQGGK